jgi:hypothetical protein
MVGYAIIEQNAEEYLLADLKRKMSLVPEKHKTISERSLAVSRTYLRQGQTVSRSIWVKIAPKNPLLKVALAIPTVVIGLIVLIFILIILGFTVLAIALMQAIGRLGKRTPKKVREQPGQID